MTSVILYIFYATIYYINIVLFYSILRIYETTLRFLLPDLKDVIIRKNISRMNIYLNR